MKQNSYGGTNALYLVPTPIGNLDDISIRIKDTLSMVDAIACEDTRVSSKLLNHLNIHKPLLINDKYHEDTSVQTILKWLDQGKNIALVSDAGMPCISDPGYTVVYTIVSHGYPVIPICGPNAALTALMAAGIDTSHFLFYGFLDASQTKRESQLQSVKTLEYTLIFYEAVHRIKPMLSSCLSILGDRQCAVARELTKIHETIYRGKLSEVIAEIDEKGEYVVIIEGYHGKDHDQTKIDQLIDLLKQQGIPNSSISKIVAQFFGLRKNDIYQRLQEK